VACHNDRLKTAGLSLETPSLERLGESAEVWEKVAHMLRTGAMPPAGKKRPDASAAQAFATALEQGLDAAAAASPNYGRVPAHRLNRTEYANAVRDLLGLEVPPSLLPADGSLLGFDNIAGVLSVSPMLLERYMSAARQVSRLAVGDPTMTVVPVTYPIEGALKQNDRLNEDLPFGSRGITLRHMFPLDGDYVMQVRLKRNSYEYIRGLGRDPQPLEIRVDGQRITRFMDVGQRKGMPSPEGYSQNELGDPEWEKNILEGDAGLEVRFPVKAGMRTIALAFEARHWEADELFLPPVGVSNKLTEDRDGNVAVASVEIGGPYDLTPPEDTASRRKIFVCRPAGAADERCATTILTTLARRAYRRPLKDKDVATLLTFCRAGQSQRGFDGCIQTGLERILASPSFLFRVEAPSTAAVAPPADTTAAAYQLSDVDLASRLSFFLWSSIPDDELLDLAAQKKLREPGALDRQVRRMMTDPRSKALVENFAGQWLQLRSLDAGGPSEDVYPEFDGELRDAFKQETERFISSMLREDRPVGELLTANYSFVNERLARHYGIPNVVGSHYRRVTLPGDTRVGLLGQGSILTVTSAPNRTSPVTRGAWILENLLGSPPPLPPPNVPAFPESQSGQGITQHAATVRERMIQHRTNQPCSGCHQIMDPIGLALENFDGVGRWRVTDAGLAIDASGQLVDGTPVDGPQRLRAALLTYPDAFEQTLIEKLLMYAAGRATHYTDMPFVRAIARDAARNDHRFSSLVLGIVNSPPFQMRVAGAEQ